MRIFFLFESCTFTLARCNDLISKLVCHATTVPFAAIPDHPFDAQRDLPVGTNLSWDLKGSTTYTATANLNTRGDVRQCFFPNFVAIFASLFRNPIQRIVE